LSKVWASVNLAGMNEYDVVVIGGGAAGLSAALVLSRARRRVAVVDAGRPRNAPAAAMHGFLGRDGAPPTSLLKRGRDEIAGYGGELVPGTVTHVRPVSADDEGRPRFETTLGDGRVLHARRVLITTGLRDAVPDLPGVAERWGRDLLHCPYCHGYEVRDEPLGVLGGSPEAVQHALLVRQWSDDVVYFTHSSELTPEERERLLARAIGVVDGPVARLVVTDDRLTGVELATGRVVPRSAVFVRPTFVAHSDLLGQLGCARHANGWFVADSVGRTSVPGVWAAGNVVNPRAQVVTAAGEGSAAAIAINNDLVEEDTELAVARYHRGLPA
jgi:thioredoxin reductase